jgi:hypothetical protein
VADAAEMGKAISLRIAMFHDHCQVVGPTRTTSPGLSLDEHFNVSISNSRYHRSPITSTPGFKPPECRTTAFHESDYELTAAMDLFQLGSLLWHLYRDEDQQSVTTFCRLAGCSNSYLDACSEHEDPIALPKADSHVPEYLHRAINLCRQEDPLQRPAAWELIALFPSDDEIGKQIAAVGGLRFHDDMTSSSMSELSYVRSLFRNVTCNICRRRAFDINYYYQIRGGGDYDICKWCFDEGRHCQDLTHLLREENTRQDRNMSDSKVVYYTSVGNDMGRKRYVY